MKGFLKEEALEEWGRHLKEWQYSRILVVGIGSESELRSHCVGQLYAQVSDWIGLDHWINDG